MSQPQSQLVMVLKSHWAFWLLRKQERRDVKKCLRKTISNAALAQFENLFVVYLAFLTNKFASADVTSGQIIAARSVTPTQKTKRRREDPHIPT